MISTKIVIDASQVTKTFNNIESEAKQTGNKIDNAFKVDVDTSKVNSMFDNIKKQASEISESFKGAFDLSSIMNFSAGGLVTGGIETAISGVVGAFSSAIQKGNEFNTALLDLQAKTGATAEEMKVLEQSAKDLFIGGIGESVAEATKIMGEAQLRLGDVFSGSELTEFTKKANALGKAYDLDVNEVIKKSAPFIKQFGLSGEEAFNLIAMGQKEGLTASDDLLDSLAEYSNLVEEAGFSAEGFINALTVGGAESGFTTDKIADSIKEMQIRIKAGDYKDAFKGIEESATTAEKALIKPIQAIIDAGNRGEITLQETLQKSTQMIDEAFKGGDISESLATQLQVAIAGTPAEELGTELFGKVFGAPVDEKAIQDKAKGIGDALSNAVGQYTTFDTTARKLELFVTETGQMFVSVGDTILKFFSELLNSTVFTYFGEIFAKVKEAVMPLIDEITMLKNEFMALFDSVGGGLDIFQIMQDGFKIAGSVIGTFIQIALQPLLLTFRAIVAIYRLVYSGVQEIINWFKKLSNETGLVSSVINGLKDGFNFLVKSISDAVGWIGKMLEKFGLIKKDKPMENIKNDTKEIEKNTEKTNQNLDKQIKSFTNISKATKKVKEDIKGIFEFDGTDIIETQTLSIRPKEITLKKIDNLFIDPTTEKSISEKLAESFGNGLSKVDFKGLFKKKENAFDETLENDRANLLTSLQKNELSYNDYAERLNEIDRQRLEAEKQMLKEKETIWSVSLDVLNNSIVTSFNESLLGENGVLAQLKTKFDNSSDIFATISDNVELLAQKTAMETGVMIAQGENALKAFGRSVFDTIKALIPAFVTQIFGTSIGTLGPIAGPVASGVLTASLYGLLSVAENAIVGLKDGVINLQGAGTSRSDSIPAMLSKGESVINARSTQINEPFLRYANNGGDLNKLFAVSMNTRNLENLISENNMILQNKNLVSNVNVNNRFEVANSGINVKFKR
jgi:hypothetical protein